MSEKQKLRQATPFLAGAVLVLATVLAYQNGSLDSFSPTAAMIAAAAALVVALSIKVLREDISRTMGNVIYYLCILLQACIALWAGWFVGQMIHPSLRWIVTLATVFSFILHDLEPFRSKAPEGKSSDKDGDSSYPEAGLYTVLDDPMNDLFFTGWRYVPFKGIITGFIKFPIGVQERDIGPVGFYPKNGSLGERGVSLALIPDLSLTLVKNPEGKMVIPAINLWRYGFLGGVWKQLQDRAASTLQVLLSMMEDWRAVLVASDQSVAEVVRAIAGGDVVERIPSSVPTAHLMKYYNLNNLPFTDDDFTEAKLLAIGLKKDDQGVFEPMEIRDFDEKARKFIERTIDEDASGKFGQRVRDTDDAAPDYKEHLEQKVRERHALLGKVRDGNGTICLEVYGVRVAKVVMKEMEPDEAVLAAYRRLAIEEYDKRAENLQTRHFMNDAEEMANKPKFTGTYEEAFDRILLANGKISSDARQAFSLDISMDDESKALLGDLAKNPLVTGAIATAAMNKMEGKKGKKGGSKS